MAQTLSVPRLKGIPTDLALFAVIAVNKWLLDLCREHFLAVSTQLQPVLDKTMERTKDFKAAQINHKFSRPFSRFACYKLHHIEVMAYAGVRV